jgi:hypothetical protein
MRYRLRGRNAAAALLFDENLSRRLVALLAELYPGSSHLADFDLLSRPDREIWSFPQPERIITHQRQTIRPLENPILHDPTYRGFARCEDLGSSRTWLSHFDGSAGLCGTKGFS